MGYTRNNIVVALSEPIDSSKMTLFFFQTTIVRRTKYLRRSLRSRFRNEFLHVLNENVCVCFGDGIIEGYTDTC